MKNLLPRLFPELTAKQINILEQYVYGFTIKEIARKNNICDDAVNQHLRMIRNAFNVNTSNEVRFVYLTRISQQLLKRSIS